MHDLNLAFAILERLVEERHLRGRRLVALLLVALQQLGDPAPPRLVLHVDRGRPLPLGLVEESRRDDVVGLAVAPARDVAGGARAARLQRRLRKAPL